MADDYSVEVSYGTGDPNRFKGTGSEISFDDLSSMVDSEGNVTDIEGMQNFLWNKYPDMVREWRGVSGSEYKDLRDKAKVYAAGKNNNPNWEDETGAFRIAYHKMKEINDKIDKGIKDFVKRMPRMGVQQGELAQRMGQRSSALGGLQKQIASRRLEGLETQAVGGGYGLGGDQLGEGDYSDIYSKLGEAQGEFSDIYGLGKEKEEAFADYAANY